MFEEIAVRATVMLMFFFALIIVMILVTCWMFLPRRVKTVGMGKEESRNEGYSSSADSYTIFHALVEATKERKEAVQEKDAGDTYLKKKENRIKNYRLYWNQPRLIYQLSEKQRKKVSEKFFKLLEKTEKQK